MGRELPVVAQAWRARWEYVTPFLAFSPEVRRVIYTTDEKFKGLVRIAGAGRRG